MGYTLNVNGTYTALFATTSIGNTIGSFVTSLPKNTIFYVTDNSGAISSIKRPNGIGINDISEDWLDVQFVLDWSTYVDGSGNFTKTDGNIYYAIYTQINSTNGLYLNALEWDISSPYVVGNTVRFFNNGATNIYTCVQNIGAAVGQDPNLDTDYWAFTDSLINLRIVPAEDSSVPLLSGSNRFNYYSIATCFAVDSTTLSAYKFKLNTFPTNNGGYGGVVRVDGANGTTPLAISDVSGTVTNTTITATHPTTSYPTIVGKKIIVRDYNYIVPYTATVTASSSTGFTATILTLGTWGSATVYNYGDFVTYASEVYVNIYTAGTTSGAPTVPTNATYWTKITGSVTFAFVEPVILAWDLFVDNVKFASDLKPVPAFSNSISEANFNVV
jgi:hypothetical protein